MKKNIITVVLLVLAVVAVVEVRNLKTGRDCGECSGGSCCLPPSPEAVSAPAEAPEHPLPLLLDLGSGKCVPCKMMLPIIGKMRAAFAGRLDVEFIDIAENEEAGRRYGISMIPTQIFFDAEGRELFRHEGFISYEELLAKWRELGYAFADEPVNTEAEPSGE